MMGVDVCERCRLDPYNVVDSVDSSSRTMLTVAQGDVDSSTKTMLTAVHCMLKRQSDHCSLFLVRITYDVESDNGDIHSLAIFLKSVETGRNIEALRF